MKIPHGEFVTRYAAKGLEDKVGVLAFDLNPEHGGPIEEGIKQAFSDLVELQKTYHHIIAVNISVVVSEYSENLDLVLAGYNVRRGFQAKNHIKESRKYLHKWISEYKDIKDPVFVYDVRRQTGAWAIPLINQLVAEGAEVYTSSGNLGDDGFDWFTLSDAQYIVSACDFVNSCRELHTAQEKGCYLFEKRFDENGRLICVTDGNIEFAPEEFPEKARNRRWLDDIFGVKKEIQGTSFASPVKLNKFMHEYMSLAVRFGPLEKIRIEVDSAWDKIPVLDKPGGDFAECLFAPYSARTDVTVFGYDRTGEWAYIAFKSKNDMMVQGYVWKEELGLE